jgi:hypothetical protein
MTAAEATAASASAGSAGGGGGGLSHAAVAGVAGGAAAAAAVVAANQDQKINAPTFAVSPQGKPIAGVTQLSMTASGGDGTSYEWNFGDGTTGSGVSVTHVFGSEGSHEVTVRSGGESRSLTIAVGSLTGTWTEVDTGTPRGGTVVTNFTHELRIVQNGATLSGTWSVDPQPRSPESPDFEIGALSGTVSSPRSVTLETDAHCLRILRVGTVNDDLTVISGTGEARNPNCEGARSFTFNRR